MTNEALIQLAREVLRPYETRSISTGTVACALLAADGQVYRGVCIDTQSGMGFCAEHSAIAAMITAGAYRILKIVAVWRGDAGDERVLSPCGRCREMIRQVDAGNLETEVVMSLDESLTLAELLPRYDWAARIA